MKSYTLANGLVVYFYQDERKHSVAVNLIVKYGGINSDFKINDETYHIGDGMAHLIEHYVLEEGKYGNLIRKFGSHHMGSNGMTYKDRTLFYFNTVKDINKGLEWLIKGIHSVEFTKEKLDAVKPAVREEIRMKKDSMDRRISETGLDNILNTLTHRNILGSIERIDSIDEKEIEKCYKAFYKPTNEFMVVAGKFNEEEVLSKIEELYNELSFSDDSVEIINIEEKKEIVRKDGKVIFPTYEPIIELMFKIDLSELSKEEQLRLDFYFSYFIDMNFSTMSPLYKYLLEENIIKKSLINGVSYISNYLIFTVGSRTNEFDIFEKKVLETINDPIFDEEIFNLSVNDTKLDFVLRKESLSSIVFPFVENIIRYDYPHMDTVDYLKQFSFDDFYYIINKLDFGFFTKTILVDKDMEEIDKIDK